MELKRGWRFGVAVLVAAGFMVCSHGADEVLGTTWVLTAKGRMSAGRFGKSSVTGPLTATFSPAGNVTLTDPSDAAVTGTLVGAPGRRMTFDLDFEEFIYDNLGHAAYYIDDLAFPRTYCTVDVAEKSGLLTMSMQFGFTGYVVIYDPYEDISTTVNLSYAVKATGCRSATLSIPAPALTWRLEGSIAFSCGPLRDAHRAVTFRLVTDGPSRERYRLYATIGGREILVSEGACVMTRAGAFGLWGHPDDDAEGVEDYAWRLAQLLDPEDPVWDWWDVSIWGVAPKPISLKVSGGVAQVSGQLAFHGAVYPHDWDKDSKRIKGSWKFSGRGGVW